MCVNPRLTFSPASPLESVEHITDQNIESDSSGRINNIGLKTFSGSGLSNIRKANETIDTSNWSRCVEILQGPRAARYFKKKSPHYSHHEVISMRLKNMTESPLLHII